MRLPTPAPVYDLSVYGHENFALSAGVVVHNSKDCADSAAGVVGYLSAHGHTELSPTGPVLDRRDLEAHYGIDPAQAFGVEGEEEVWGVDVGFGPR